MTDRDLKPPLAAALAQALREAGIAFEAVLLLVKPTDEAKIVAVATGDLDVLHNMILGAATTLGIEVIDRPPRAN